MKKEDLPKKVAVFPLSNFIIFPKTTVPLNIFEPRYIDMINDSMKSNKFIGMIQPKKKELIVLNKTDLIDKKKVKEIVNNFSKNTKFEVITMSTLEKKTISKIKAKLISYAS